jgi:hypothetical protein
MSTKNWIEVNDGGAVRDAVSPYDRSSKLASSCRGSLRRKQRMLPPATSTLQLKTINSPSPGEEKLTDKENQNNSAFSM